MNNEIDENGNVEAECIHYMKSSHYTLSCKSKFNCHDILGLDVLKSCTCGKVEISWIKHLIHREHFK